VYTYIGLNVMRFGRGRVLAPKSLPPAATKQRWKRSRRFGQREDTMKKMIDRNESGASPRRRFEETYKRHAVDLTLQGDRTVKTVAKELGLPAWQLYEWRKLFAPRPGEAGPAPQTLEEAEKEIGRLRGEVVRLREREVVLK
jgi:transposase-like protein